MQLFRSYKKIKMIKKITRLLLLLSVTFVSCVSTSVTNIQRTSSSDNIQVYISKIPDKPFEEIAHLASAGSIFHSEKALLKKLKAKAVKENADAIINLKFGFIPWLFVSIPMVEGTTIKYIK